MENTSYIAKISYQIENWLYKGKDKEYIIGKIKELQAAGEFPSNLELVDAFFDNSNSISGCAFFDKNTGETIVGFAGTNLDNSFSDGAKDIVTDVGIFIDGISPNSSKLNIANSFVSNLKKQGYNITQSTGHSLGGAICVLVGVKQNIPSVVSYNGAPLYVLVSKNNVDTILEIKEMLKTYNGQIYRFVTNDDILNNASDFANGFYVGEKIIFHNGTGHDLNNFLSSIEQRFIKEILQSKNSHWVNGNLEVDFDGDGNAEISITPEQLRIKNLLSTDNTISNGTTISINPQSLLELGAGFSSMINNDVSWIAKTVTICDEKNNEIKNSKNSRADKLCDKVVEALDSSGLNELLCSINRSHGALLENDNKKALEYFDFFNTYEITRKFDWLGSSGGHIWFKEGHGFDEYDLIRWINDLKSCSHTLLYQVTTTGTIDVPITYGTPNSYFGQKSSSKYTFTTISDIGNALVAVTNNFLPKTRNVFKGTGLRSGKHDGIVDSLSDVLEVQLSNIKEISTNISSVENMATGLSDNFSSMDRFLKNYISSGGGKVQFREGKLPKNYNAYLEECNIFEDVNVIKAFDLQVEEASEKLSIEILKDYDTPLQQIQTRFTNLSSSFEDFNRALSNINEMLNDNITSKKSFYRLNANAQYDYIESQPYNRGNGYQQTDYEYVTETYQHGNLSSILPPDLSNYIEYANKNIVPILNEFYAVTNVAEVYNENIVHLQDYFKGEIEKSVYASMDLSSIVKAQNLISITINRMSEEVNGVDRQIQSQFKGKAMQSYQSQLRDLKKILQFFNQMISDCFGTNLK